MLIEGRGTHTDKIEAFKWYYMAALQTDYYNKDILALMEVVRFIRTTQRPSFLDS